MFALLSQQSYDTSADLIVGRSIAQGFLTEYPESQSVLLILGQRRRGWICSFTAVWPLKGEKPLSVMSNIASDISSSVYSHRSCDIGIYLSLSKAKTKKQGKERFKTITSNHFYMKLTSLGGAFSFFAWRKGGCAWYGPHDLLASHGLATAALTILSTEAQRTARLKDKQQRLLAQVRGRLTPNNPGASTPFARERQRVEAAMQANEFTFRFKQAISIDAPRLVRRRRNFSSVLQPIFQLIRLFLKEKQLYAGILRRFSPDIFPGVIVAFARVIEAAIAEIDRRFREAGSKGLGIALSEGVAALDQLGNFCFTGDPRVLPIKVMRLLGTMDKGQGLVNLVGWPQLSNGRPVLMHITSLEYHYDRTVASNRHSQLWFAELRETIAFVAHQVRRGLNRGLRSGGRSGVGAYGDVNGSSNNDILSSPPSFLTQPYRNFKKLSAEVLKFNNHSTEESKIILKTQHDFAEEMFIALMEGSRKGHPGIESIAPTHSTWPSILRAAI
ncbi:hypothetical protein HZ326_23223 [Fusarium oxysporum f. sp. albedinis]|nr:hypothetical protein HZ326_23223 [Fusarium oxysporum f. sp. albedinis]